MRRVGVVVVATLAALGLGTVPALAARGHDQHVHHHAASANVVLVSVEEWKLAASVRTIPAGRVTFFFANYGKTRHVIALLRTDRAGGAGLASQGLPLAARRAMVALTPAQGRALTLNLTPGRYLLSSALPGRDRRSMIAPVRVVVSVASGGTSPQPAAPATLRLATVDMLKFDKATLAAPAGRVTIVLTNTVSLPHNIAITGRGVDVKGTVVAKGSSSTVTARLAPGTYTFYCSVPGHAAAGMKGVLRVSAGKGATPKPAEPPPAPSVPSTPATPPTPAPSAPPATAGAIEIQTAGMLGFDRSVVQVPAGTVTLSLRNNAPLEHNIAIKGNGVDVQGPNVATGGVSTVSANLAPGLYTFYCSLPGHEAAGMRGTLQVYDAGSPPPPPPPPPLPSFPPPPLPPAPVAGALELQTAGVIGFNKSSLAAPAGTVTLRLTNLSPLEHNVAIKGNGVDVRGSIVPSGGISQVSANLAPGTYFFYCTISGHEGAGMRGTLTITAGGGSPPPSPPPPSPPPPSEGLQLAVSGKYTFDKTSLWAPEGKVTLVLTNNSSLSHGIAIKGSHGIDVTGPVVPPGGTSTVTVWLTSDKWEFYCPVDGHRSAGMEGTLIVGNDTS